MKELTVATRLNEERYIRRLVVWSGIVGLYSIGFFAYTLSSTDQISAVDNLRAGLDLLPLLLSLPTAILLLYIAYQISRGIRRKSIFSLAYWGFGMNLAARMIDFRSMTATGSTGNGPFGAILAGFALYTAYRAFGEYRMLYGDVDLR